MLEAKAYIYLESIWGSEKKIRYISDLSSEMVTCNSDDLFLALKREHGFKIDTIEDIKTKLAFGTSLILDLESKESFRHEDNASVILSRQVIRSSGGNYQKDKGIFDKRVEEIVNKRYFSK